MASLTDDFFKKILSIEGGYQAMPSDKGNYCNNALVGTKYGMSAVAVSAWWGRCPTVSEMKNLKEQDAFNFYAWYFNRYGLFQIENQLLFELIANNTMGSPGNACKIEQKILNNLGYNIKVDGNRGPETINAINDAWRKHGADFYNQIRNAWIQYLKDLNRPEFIQGWLIRMDKFPPLNVEESLEIGIPILILVIGTYLIFK